MTINPESVKAYARELLEAEERGRREVNAEMLAACRCARNEASLSILCTHDELFEALTKVRGILQVIIDAAERQGEALEVEAGNSHHTGD